MGNMKKDEMSILKAASIKLSDEVAFIVTFQYHTEKNAEGRGDRSKSRYRWLGRVVNIADVRQEIMALMRDDVRLNPYRWPNDPSWNGSVCWGKDAGNMKAASWLNMKIKKLLPWEKGLMKLGGWENSKQEYNLNAVYDLTGFQTSSGATIAINDREALLQHVGENIFKEHVQKSKLPRI